MLEQNTMYITKKNNPCKTKKLCLKESLVFQETGFIGRLQSITKADVGLVYPYQSYCKTFNIIYVQCINYHSIFKVRNFFMYTPHNNIQNLHMNLRNKYHRMIFTHDTYSTIMHSTNYGLVYKCKSSVTSEMN